MSGLRTDDLSSIDVENKEVSDEIQDSPDSVSNYNDGHFKFKINNL